MGVDIGGTTVKIGLLSHEGNIIEKFEIKTRLYVIEEKLPENFIKINQSCIANINQIERFDASISGTLKIRFKNGYTDYVSRRQLKNVKERIGI